MLLFGGSPEQIRAFTCLSMRNIVLVKGKIDDAFHLCTWQYKFHTNVVIRELFFFLCLFYHVKQRHNHSTHFGCSTLVCHFNSSVAPVSVYTECIFTFSFIAPSNNLKKNKKACLVSGWVGNCFSFLSANTLWVFSHGVGWIQMRRCRPSDQGSRGKDSPKVFSSKVVCSSITNGATYCSAITHK